MPALGRRELLLLALLLGLPGLVEQLHFPAPRLDSDAVEYFSHVRSLYFDHDLDFTNEFEHFGILGRGDKVQPTATGHRRTIFSVGPALLWLPFYAVGDGLARLRGTVEDGYSSLHIRAVCLASLFYGVLGLLLVYGVLRDLVGRFVAAVSVVLLLYATFLYWYLAVEPAMSHAVSFFASALLLAAFWPRRAELGWGGAALLGWLVGLAACVRWQNAVLLLLPAATLLSQLRRRPALTVVKGSLTLAAFGLGVLPQLLAWKAIFGQYLLLDPPHGRDFLRLDHPFLLQTFFSSRHGLFYWTPLLWAGYLGYASLLWRRPRAALALLLPLLTMSYVNACSGDWWAGGSFSNRRFDSLLPLLALGLARSLAVLDAAVRRWPQGILVPALLAVVGANLLFMEQYRRNWIPRDDTLAFSSVAHNSAQLVASSLGSPLAWPANWLFAAEHGLPASRYDEMVGPYLFYRQNNLDGLIDLGELRGDRLLGEGWGPRRACEGASCRRVLGHARAFAPLDVPEALDVSLRAQGTGSLTLAVNGWAVGRFALSPQLAQLRIRVPAQYWRCELNELAFEADAVADLDSIRFVRPGRPR